MSETSQPLTRMHNIGWKYCKKLFVALCVVFLITACYATGRSDETGSASDEDTSFDLASLLASQIHGSAEPAKPLHPANIQDLQMILAGLGYEPGPADGIIGNKTRRAIRAFQRQNGLEEDGLLTQDLSIRLYKMAKKNMCDVIAFSDHATLFSHRLCKLAQQYQFQPTKVFAAGDGMYMITIPKRNALALTANADTFVNSMTLLMDRVFATQESPSGVRIAMISGSSCIAKGSRTHQATTTVEPC